MCLRKGLVGLVRFDCDAPSTEIGIKRGILRVQGFPNLNSEEYAKSGGVIHLNFPEVSAVTRAKILSAGDNMEARYSIGLAMRHKGNS